MDDAAVTKIEEQTKEFLQQANVEQLIKDNVIEFKVEQVQYRVGRPSFEQKMQVSQTRTKKFIELLKDPANMLEKDLIALYEQRGISVKEMDLKYSDLQRQKDEWSAKLGAGLAENKSKEELDIYKVELESIILEQNRLLMQKSVLLDSTIEAQINVFSFTFLAALITERKDGELWVKAWSSIEQFIKESEQTVNTVIWHVAIVSKNEIPTM